MLNAFECTQVYEPTNSNRNEAYSQQGGRPRSDALISLKRANKPRVLVAREVVGGFGGLGKKRSQTIEGPT